MKTRCSFFSYLPRWLAFGISVALTLVRGAMAQHTTWANVGTDWAIGANWIGGVAPPEQVDNNFRRAFFSDATPIFHPQLTANRSTNGIEFADGAGAYTLSSTNGAVLTVGIGGLYNRTMNLQTVSADLRLGTSASFHSEFSGGSFLISGNVDTNGFDLRLRGGSSVVSTISGVISGTGQVVIYSNDWTLTGANTYTGGTRILGGGTLVVGTSSALPTNTNVTLDSSSTGGAGALILNAPVQVGALSLLTSGGSNQVVINSTTLTLGGTVAAQGTGSIVGTGTLDLGAASRTFDTGAPSALTVTALVSGVGSTLVKTGAGELQLTAANIYTGGTVVSAGRLLATNTTGSAVGSSTLTVQNSGTVGGTGFIGGLGLIQSGGRVAPGLTSAVGTLTFTAGLTLEAGSIMDFNLTSTNDLIRIAGGTLTGPASGLVTFNFSVPGQGGTISPGTYTLFDFTSAATTNLDVTDFAVGTVIPGTQAGHYSFNLTATTLDLVYTGNTTNVPEPSTYAVLLAVAALGAAIQRRTSVRASALGHVE